jgi:hypothetical protein
MKNKHIANDVSASLSAIRCINKREKRRLKISKRFKEPKGKPLNIC